MSNSELNERIMECKSDLNAINGIIEEYKPYIASCASEFSGRFLQYGIDDELSVALMAFYQAIISYDISRGSFLKFTKTVIYGRMVDYSRSNKSNGRLAYLNDYFIDNDGEMVENDIATEKSVDEYYESESNNVRRLEIIELNNELSVHDISFDELVKESPKAQKTKDASKKILRFLIENKELAARVRKKGLVPVTEIEAAVKVTKKTIERMRKYIIASVIILTGDYEYLKEYLKI